MKSTNEQSVSKTYRTRHRLIRSILTGKYRTANFIYSALLLTLFIVSPLAPIAAQDGLDYETVRFYTKNSRPESILASAFSPNGRYVALSFNRRNLGARDGVTIVDLQNKSLLRKMGNGSFHTLAFSSDSNRVVGIGNYSGVQMFDLLAGSYQRYRNINDHQGTLGFDIEEKNGKLLVSRINEKASSVVDQLRVGDEILAINEGAKSKHYNDSYEWRTLAGKSRSKVLKILMNNPGTWYQLRLVRKGSAEPIETAFKRFWPGNKTELPKHSSGLTLAMSNGKFQFLSADALSNCSYIGVRDIRTGGQHAVSPDAKRFAALGTVVENPRKYCLEVHSLESGNLEHSAILDSTNFRYVKFSPDSQQVLVGTRDTIEIFDTTSGDWQEPVVLTPPNDADDGRVVTRRIPLGLGLPGDLYTTTRSVVYSKPAALTQFGVAPNGTLAIASETGEIVMASLDSKERTGLLGDNILGAAPEMIEFSPTGNNLVAFAKGVLHIFDISQKQQQ